MRLARAAALILLVLLLDGCYMTRTARGELHVLCNRQSIEDRLADEHPLDPALRRKLELVLQVRKFAFEQIGLDESDSFTTFFDTEGGPAVWNVSAARSDQLLPITWSFPIVGVVPYLGFFDRAEARAQLVELKAQGLDSLALPSPAYSTLGWFDDPVFTSLLREDEARIAEVVIHELTHNTVWIPGEVSLNENLATFVGREGARQFFEARGGPRDPALVEAEQRKADDEVFQAAMNDLHDELSRLYAASGPRARKLELKAAAIARFRRRYAREVRPRLHDDRQDWVLDPRLPLNNALILMFRRYHGEGDLFAALHDRCGRDLRQTVQALRSIADASDPRADLARRARALAKGPPR
ncbi:MAG: aminopeptidase [Planctomycetota bacterium]